MGDARAEHAPEGLVDPAVAWGTLGAHVVNAKGARGALEWGVVSVRTLVLCGRTDYYVAPEDMLGLGLAVFPPIIFPYI